MSDIHTAERRLDARPLPRLSPRDLINVGIFTAIYFVVFFGFGMAGFAGPWFSALGFILGILANGVVVSLYLSRVPKVGALTLMGVISSLLMILTGHPWVSLVVSVVLGLIADLIARAGDHRNPRLNALAYGVVSVWYIGPLLPIAWDTAGYRDYVASAMGKDYAEVYVTIFGPTALSLWAVAFLIVGVIGGLFGQGVLRRQFRRAGVA